jgi:uncharacterized RDD family membrane protein YckC
VVNEIDLQDLTGAGALSEDGALAMEEPVALTPENAHEAAAEAVQSSREELGIELDYSIESLETLDRILNDVHVSGRKSREMGGAVIIFGCYLGEVIIRKLGGKWLRAADAGFTAATGFPIVLWLSENFSCNPLGKVAKRIDNGSEDSLPFFFKALPGGALSRQLKDRFEASIAETSTADINWPTAPDESGNVAPLLAAMANSPGPESSRAAYLVRATAELTSRGWNPAEFQVVARGPGGMFTVPCVVKKGDEFALIFSHAGSWAKADYARFKRWYEQVRSCENTKRIPIIIADDNDPVVLREEGMTGDRYGISLEHIEWNPDKISSEEGGAGEPKALLTALPGHTGGGRTPPSPPTNHAPGMNKSTSPETDPDFSRTNPYAAPRSPIVAKERPTARRATGYAGFWRRFAAIVIDSILLSVVNFGILCVIGFLAFYVAAEDSVASHVIVGVGYSLMMLAHQAYFIVMESSAMQATLGKASMGMNVVDLYGRRISVSRSFGRTMGKWISYIIFMVGYIMAAFTERKQALHDLMAGTLVVKIR